MGTLSLTKEERIYNGEKTPSSVSSAGKTGLLHVKEEKAMAPHSSTLAWRIPGTGEPRGLPSTGSHRVGHD